jgi:VWFA-related protein
MKIPSGKKPAKALAFYFACCCCWAQTGSTSTEKSIRVDVNLVTLKFAVHDMAGNPANNLSQQQFQVFERGQPQKIVFFEAPRNASGITKKLRVAFLLDVSGSTLTTRSEEITAAQTFLQNIHEFTQIGIFGFTDKLIPFQGFTSRRSLATKALTSARQHLGKTAIYDSLNTLISHMDNAPERAKTQNAIIVISDAMDGNYWKSPQTITLARINSVALYTILVPSAAQLYINPASAVKPLSPSQKNQDKRAKEKAFARLSAQTGGKHFGGFEAILNFNQVMAQINDDIFGNLYSLGYYASSPYAGQKRSVRVQASNPRMSVSTPFENSPQALSAKRQFIEGLFGNQPAAMLTNGLLEPFHELGGSLDLLKPRRSGGETGQAFRIRISPHSLQKSKKGDIKTQLGVIGLLVDQQGKEVVRLREIFPINLEAKSVQEGRRAIYTNKLLAPPGTYRLKIALLEIASWKISTYENTVHIEGP